MRRVLAITPARGNKPLAWVLDELDSSTVADAIRNAPLLSEASSEHVLVIPVRPIADEDLVHALRELAAAIERGDVAQRIAECQENVGIDLPRRRRARRGMERAA